MVAICDNAFQNCSNITSINIPNIVTTIGNKAFEGCSGLTSLSIGKKIKSIGQNAFKGCSGLNSITVASGNTVYDSRNNCNAIIETASGKLIQGCNSTVIPDDVTSIGDAAFYGCTGLTSVTIPNSVTSIGSYAFSGCSGLTSVNIPNSVTTIGSSAFNGCSGLTSVNIGNSVTSIGYQAFYGCSGLTSVTIPNSVTTIGDMAFFRCSGLSSVTLNSNAVVSADRTKNHYLANIFGSLEKQYIIGDNVAAIGEYAFANFGLTSVTIPNSVRSIGSYAFSGCSGLTTVNIGNGVTSIGNEAFSGCSGLTSVNISDLAAWFNISFENAYANPCFYAHHLYLNGIEVSDFVIPDGVKSFLFGAFYGCSGLTSVTIPNSVTSIGDYTFYDCSGLASVTIGNSVTSIGIQAFNGCNGLTSVTINSNDIVSADRTENNNLNNIFGSQVKEYIIGNRVTSIGENAFRGNTNLNTVSVGKYIGSIGDNAFYGCSNLATFTCYAVDIPTANSSVFEGIDLTMATLYVPASALEEYEETKPWKRFGTILPIDENTVPTAIDTAAPDDYKEYFDLSGRRVTSSQRGLLIVRDRSGKTRKVMVK